MDLFDDPQGSSLPAKPNPELIRLIGQRFVSRKDVKAEQAKDGAWYPVREVTSSGKHDGPYVPFSMQDFNDHLTGVRTFGHYVVGTDQTTKFFCFDLDLNKQGFYLEDPDPDGDPEDFPAIVGNMVDCEPREVWAAGKPQAAIDYFTQALRVMAEGLAQRVIRMNAASHVAITNSGGKGMHVYGFMNEPNLAVDVREVALDVLSTKSDTAVFEPIKGDNFWRYRSAGAYSNITIEVFPKQEAVSKGGFGNLLRLPLGVNLKTGKRGYFVNCKSGLNKLPEMDAIRALSGDLPWD